jgi:16S rRNA (uracil1498-N3)-methyltransferase
MNATGMSNLTRITSSLDGISASTGWAPTAEQAHYIQRVLRHSPGDRILVIDPQLQVEALVEVVAPGTRDMLAERLWTVITCGPIEQTPPRQILVIQALAKDKKVDAIVRDITELGATHFWAVVTERTVVVPKWELEAQEQDAVSPRMLRWQRIVDEAVRQCLRKDTLQLRGILTLEHALAEFEHEGPVPLRIALDPHAEATLGQLLLQNTGAQAVAPIALAIGPEGGFGARDLALLERYGFQRVRLAPYVLRTETAAAAALGAVHALSQLNPAPINPAPAPEPQRP